MPHVACVSRLTVFVDGLTHRYAAEGILATKLDAEKNLHKLLVHLWVVNGKMWHCGIAVWQETCINSHCHKRSTIYDHDADWCEMEQSISILCCTKQAKHYLSHVKLRRQESCEWVVILDGAQILLSRTEAACECNMHNPWALWMKYVTLHRGEWRWSWSLPPDDGPLLRGWHGSKAETPSKLASYTILWGLTAR